MAEVLKRRALEEQQVGGSRVKRMVTGTVRGSVMAKDRQVDGAEWAKQRMLAIAGIDGLVHAVQTSGEAERHVAAAIHARSCAVGLVLAIAFRPHSRRASFRHDHPRQSLAPTALVRCTLHPNTRTVHRLP